MRVSLTGAAYADRRVLIAVISDTHMPRGPRRLPDSCVERLRTADLILHAGDLMTAEVLAELEGLGPAVEAAGARLGMVHDAGPARGRLQRLRRRFPEADAVVFGHSHIPLHEEAEGFQIFNPGSPTERRRQRRHTMGVARVENGAVRFELVEL